MRRLYSAFTPNVHDNPERNLKRMRQREITISPSWIRAQDRGIGLDLELSVALNSNTQLEKTRKTGNLDEMSRGKEPHVLRALPATLTTNSIAEHDTGAEGKRKKTDPADTERRQEREADRTPITPSMRNSMRSALPIRGLNSSPGSEDLPSPRIFLRRVKVIRSEADPTAAHPECTCGLDHGDWDLVEIIDKKLENDETQYLVRWADSLLPGRHLRFRPDGSIYVQCRGRQWSIPLRLISTLLRCRLKPS